MVGEGFPRALRLRRSEDFRRVQGRGRKWVSRDLVVLWTENPEGVRFGLSVSRKVGNAVHRNRVKRWLREAIRRERAGLAGVDVVFVARSSASDAGFEAIRSQVVAAFARIARSPRAGGA